MSALRAKLGKLRVNRRINRVEAELGHAVDRSRNANMKANQAAKDAEFQVREVNRIAPQLAALEAKVEDLRQRLDDPAFTLGDEEQQARSLVEEIRLEHQRIRVRLSAVTTYEERLRRIEEKLGLPHD